MLFIIQLRIMCALAHLIPSDTLALLGEFSDVVSDHSPSFLRGIEHVAFSLLLN